MSLSDLLREILAAIVKFLRSPIRIELDTAHATKVPQPTPQGELEELHMPNFELNSDAVYTIPILTTNVAGTVEPAPAGDTFSVTSSAPASLGASIGKTAAGGPAVVLTPLVRASPSITVTVSDSAGLVQAVQICDIVVDVTPTNVVLDIADATHTAQPTPTNPGP